MWKVAFALAAACSLTSCASQSIDAVKLTPERMEKVFKTIKNEIGVYNYASYAQFTRDLRMTANAPCADKPINLIITKIKVEISTTLTATNSAGLTMAIPIATGITFGPGTTTSNSQYNSQLLTFYAWLGTENQDYSQFSGQQGGEITEALNNLKTSLNAISKSSPCLDTDPGGNKDPENSFTFGFTVTDESSVKAGIKLVVVDANFGTSGKSVSGNTITVYFKPDQKQTFQ